jgi:23S rRNA (adenine2503-C2)-methyltransferase
MCNEEEHGMAANVTMDTAMRVLAKTGREDVATVYLAETAGGGRIEFVESVQPPIPRDRKWVLILSTLYGCPGGCRFCDAGSFYRGKLTMEEMLAQVDYMVGRRYRDRRVPVEKFKVQFARMGEPAFNKSVLEALEELTRRFDAPGLMPCVSTVAPKGAESFFERLLGIKRDLYDGRFQLQFSIHTTDDDLASWLMPLERWGFDWIARYGELWFEKGDRKVALNFALAEGMPVSAGSLLRHFSPDIFLIKMTPVNPTFRARENGIASRIVPGRERYDTIETLRSAGYEVILSIGELEENHIGSNCGQYVAASRDETSIEGAYTYPSGPM